MDIRKEVAFDSTNIVGSIFEKKEGDATSKCDVFFVGGSRYRFFRIPAALFDDWTKAESAGKFFAANIRGKFTSVKFQCSNCKKILDSDTIVISASEERLTAFCKDCYGARS